MKSEEILIISLSLKWNGIKTVLKNIIKELIFRNHRIMNSVPPARAVFTFSIFVVTISTKPQ